MQKYGHDEGFFGLLLFAYPENVCIFAKSMSEKKSVTFILNPISGQIKKAGIPAQIAKYLDHDVFDHRICYTDHAGHATQIAAEEAEKGTDVVVAVGGDGTINEIGRALVHTQTALGIVPCGSGNGLARHLNIPLNVRKALHIINQHDVCDLDYGIINRQPFFCTCGMGFDAFISMKFAEGNKRGPIKYIEYILKEGLTYQPETYRIEDEEGNIEEHKAYLVSCANASQYGNNAYIAPQASMADGMLDVIIMEPFDIFDAPQVSFDIMNKTLDKSSKIKTMRSRNIKVHRAHPGPVHYDGDPVIMGENLEISLVEKGIKILVNPDKTEHKNEPNALQNAVCELFNTINNARTDMNRQGRKMKVLNRKVMRRIKK